MMTEELVLIAHVRKPRGLKGDIFIKTYTSDDKRFLKLKKVLVRLKNGEMSERKIASAQILPNGVTIKIEGVDDCDAAELLRNAELLIPESERPKLPKGRAYYDQIIGMTVLDDETGSAIGTVKNVLDMPAGDVFVLDLNGIEHLVTNAGEEVRSINVEKKEIRVRLLEAYKTGS
jgi:16S rRNA processing protein RimM